MILLLNNLVCKKISGKTWKTAKAAQHKKRYITSWGFGQHVMLTVVWKTWHTSDRSHIIQIIVVYKHFARTKGLLSRFAGLYNHEKVQKVLLNMEKKKLGNFFIEKHNFLNCTGQEELIQKHLGIRKVTWFINPFQVDALFL